MQKMIEDLNKYILETLGFTIDPKLVDLTNSLPVFLKNSYFVYSASIFNKHYVLAVARDPETNTPAQIAKQMELFEKIEEKPCIYVANNCPAYNRQRLVIHKVRFIIPGVQMYLPDLCIDWRKTSSKHPLSPRTLTPAAQVVLIYALTNGCSEPFTPSKLADKLGYTRMTMTRALDTLEALGIGKSVRKSKERLFYFQENQYFLWKQTLPFMQTPVRETRWIQADALTKDIIRGLGKIAGLSALARQSKLIHPSCPIYAVHSVQWKILLETRFIRILPIAEGAQLQIEVWSYDPSLFAKDDVVDDFSLYLSLKDQKDERIEKALENLLADRKW